MYSPNFPKLLIILMNFAHERFRSFIPQTNCPLLTLTFLNFLNDVNLETYLNLCSPLRR